MRFAYVAHRIRCDHSLQQMRFRNACSESVVTSRCIARRQSFFACDSHTSRIAWGVTVAYNKCDSATHAAKALLLHAALLADKAFSDAIRIRRASHEVWPKPTTNAIQQRMHRKLCYFTLHCSQTKLFRMRFAYVAHRIRCDHSLLGRYTFVRFFRERQCDNDKCPKNYIPNTAGVFCQRILFSRWRRTHGPRTSADCCLVRRQPIITVVYPRVLDRPAGIACRGQCAHRHGGNFQPRF
jgi:hypothetical protein